MMQSMLAINENFLVHNCRGGGGLLNLFHTEGGLGLVHVKRKTRMREFLVFALFSDIDYGALYNCAKAIFGIRSFCPERGECCRVVECEMSTEIYWLSQHVT